MNFFILLGHPRTGTNFIRHTLKKNLPDILWCGEILIDGNEFFLWPSYLYKSITQTKVYSSEELINVFDQFIKEISNFATFTNHSSFAIDIKFTQIGYVPHLYKYIKNNHDAITVHIKRRNYLRTLISAILMQERVDNGGSAHLPSDKYKKLNINVQKARDDINALEGFDNDVYRLFSTTNKYIEIIYEDFQQDSYGRYRDTIKNKLSKFIIPKPAPVITTTNVPLNNLIENLDHFSNDPFFCNFLKED